MTVSVVVPTKGSSKDLKACLDSLKKQTRRPDEIVVVFDSRSDKNVTLPKKYGGRAVFDTHKTIGGAYYTGAKAAKGVIIAFLDDDCAAPKGWLERLEKEFADETDVVGGEDPLPENSSFFQKAVYQIDKARIMKAPVYGRAALRRLRAANIAYRKKVFLKENFNASLKGLQEPEFHHRLFRNGFAMKFDPSLYVYHKRRNSLRSIFYQIYRNGKAKTELLKMHADMVSAIDVMPFAYAAASIALAYYALSYGKWIFFSAWLAMTAAYFLGKPLLVTLRTGELKYYPALVPIVFIREVAYALGIIAGAPALFKR